MGYTKNKESETKKTGRINNRNFEIGERIEFLREEKGLTRKLLAELMGLKEVTIKKIEYGEIRLTVENARKAKAVLGTSYSYLLDGKQESPKVVEKILTEIELLSKEDKLEIIKKICELL